MLALRLVRGARPAVQFRRLLVAAASAGTGFLLLCTLGYAMGHPGPSGGAVLRLAWCLVPIAATVQFAVAVARTDPATRPRAGLAAIGLGPGQLTVLTAVSTALSCTLGSLVALLLFLHLRGGLTGLPLDGAAAGLLAADQSVPLPAVLTLLAVVPLVASAACALVLRPRSPGRLASGGRPRRLTGFGGYGLSTDRIGSATYGRFGTHPPPRPTAPPTNRADASARPDASARFDATDPAGAADLAGGTGLADGTGPAGPVGVDSAGRTAGPTNSAGAAHPTGAGGTAGLAGPSSASRMAVPTNAADSTGVSGPAHLAGPAGPSSTGLASGLANTANPAGAGGLTGPGGAGRAAAPANAADPAGAGDLGDAGDPSGLAGPSSTSRVAVPANTTGPAGANGLVHPAGLAGPSNASRVADPADLTGPASLASPVGVGGTGGAGGPGGATGPGPTAGSAGAGRTRGAGQAGVAARSAAAGNPGGTPAHPLLDPHHPLAPLPAPDGLPWGAAVLALGIAVETAYAARAGAAENGPALPGGFTGGSLGVLVGWVLTAIGLALAGPALTHLSGRLLQAVRPGALRLLAGRVLMEEATRIGRPLGVVCAVASGAYAMTVLPAGTRSGIGPLTALGALLVAGCAVATLLTTAAEARNARAGVTQALLRIGAPAGPLRTAAALRAGALLVVLAPLTWVIAQLAALPLAR